MIEEVVQPSGLLLAVLLAVVQKSRVPYVVNKQRAEEAVEPFHQRLSQGRYEDLYDMCHGHVQALETKQCLLAGIRGTLERFGNLVSAEQKIATCFPLEVRFVYHSRYDKGDAAEILQWRLEHVPPSLLLYHVSPGFGGLPKRVEHERPPEQR